MKFILGIKIGMSQVFDEKGMVTPITLVEAGPCQVLQVKIKDKDGYEAIQIGFIKKKPKKVKKTEKAKEFKWIKEFRSGKSELSELKPNDIIDVSLFKENEKVKVSGLSKGKGFQGGVKRWGFSGRNATHGVKHEHRTLGSVGTSIPARVLKGRKMPGRTGRERITVKNLEIIKIDKENNLLAIRGAAPGRRGTLLEIRG
ncbi:MAG: 50S ribosomal protein L3 [Candidatus Nealsonbacteria bacterium CG_4_9_14_3_um_filter_35_11]|uniref:50S ribosomal protein L3 n=1 Tax=Candidatus Nealsonbacteria bacterium CG02_land_8_20_14_3_00_34_20 TaxID=1974698 RepID=A0A2M7DAR6_9BACT|nr:MAG: 50S ribosomal protein L3 [Candidatus Nealsonbacteria bacterium CG02_land_8_20_14_3_00_34_20]PIW92661.1 MAG: 50S ribosomal protein L3 [Candidatus Nealsonbacteria bacterium CG_4_8_14_3_um_filter_34_13]PIZ89896.1 MAG: 50S ribosomal protein L3 [Candidatus Nealsonbacteria bacterium CG_4_10_14_0_2_um_filter_35_20]PJA84904.1 MAG: 50S ribosomal protein L3 [Candidatus Nealsonbacteria bacterium CG_4_9_14_3_um_filter_35_11]